MKKFNPIFFPPKPAMDLSKAVKEIENAAKSAKPILLKLNKDLKIVQLIKK